MLPRVTALGLGQGSSSLKTSKYPPDLQAPRGELFNFHRLVMRNLMLAFSICIE